MAKEWTFYLCNVNDKLASIALDLGLRPEAPMQGKPWLLWVWVYLRSPKPNGLSDRSELEALSTIEDELAKKVGVASEAVQAGRITTQGRREFYLYGKSSDGFEEAVKTVMRRFENYRFALGSENDPEWNQYLNLLYPSEEDMQRIANRELLEKMKELGDSLQPVRDVHHWIYFHTAVERERYASEVQELGYQIEDRSEGNEGERPFGLNITRDQSAVPDQIDEAVLELFRLAKEMDAEYDGWEAQVIAAKN